MKKIYINPELMVVELGTRNMLMGMSATDSLGIVDGGDTDSNNIIEGDVKGISNNSIWDSEW